MSLLPPQTIRDVTGSLEALHPLSADADSFTMRALVGIPTGGLAGGYRGGRLDIMDDGGCVVSTLVGHTADVTALACGARGEIVSGSADRTVKVWEGGECVMTFAGHTGAIRSVATSPLDAIVVSGAEDRQGRVWDRVTGTASTLVGHRDVVTAVAVLSSGDAITGSRDYCVRVWARGAWVCAAVHEQATWVNTLFATERGGFLVGGGSPGFHGFLSLWSGGKAVWTHKPHRVVHKVFASSKGWIAVKQNYSLEVLSDSAEPMACVPNAHNAAVSAAGNLVVTTATAGAVYKVYRTIDAMLAAWALHAGLPPPPNSADTREAVVARTISLRRLCRPRDAGPEHTLEIVEPFARDVVGFV